MYAVYTNDQRKTQKAAHMYDIVSDYSQFTERDRKMLEEIGDLTGIYIPTADDIPM